jgi:uncharacterized protein YbjT (DUF2867 family)
MNLLILGGTRGTGRKVVERALARGHDVTVVARKPAAMDLVHASLNVVEGDVCVPSTLLAAARGQDAVIFAVGATLSALKQNPTIFSDGTEHTIAAMRPAGVRRLVVLSSHGSGDSREFGGFVQMRILRPLLLGPYFDDHERQEAVVRRSGLDWVIVRPTRLTNGAAGQRVTVLERGAPPWQISRTDVAEFLLAAAETDSYVGKALSIGAR